MWNLDFIIAFSMLVSLTLYALMAGADYGGGVWDLFAAGPRETAQRNLIQSVIGPVWEANHVWLILVVVALFTGFPGAFALICTALHIPLTLLIIGIVLRGSAFSFRTYDSQKDKTQRRWGLIFSIASIFTPIMLGVIVGAISSGQLYAPIPAADLSKVKIPGPALAMAMSAGKWKFDFISPWLAAFPISVGLLALSLFAFLAATYLTCETNDKDLREDFRKRALISQAFVAASALLVFILAGTGAPAIRQHLQASHYAMALHVVTAFVSIGAIASLIVRRYHRARMFAAGQATLILWGWAFAQFPFLVRPDLDVYNCAAPNITLKLLLIALIVGGIILFPCIFYLLNVFHSKAPAETVGGVNVGAQHDHPN